MKNPVPQMTKGQRDASLNSVTKKSGGGPKRQHLESVHSGSTRKGSKQGK